jgi:hypothetical protein
VFELTRVRRSSKNVVLSVGVFVLFADGIAAEGGGVAREIGPSFGVLLFRCERTLHFFISSDAFREAVHVNSDLSYYETKLTQ